MIETKHRLIQTDLFDNEIELNVVWVFIGIFPANKLGITHNEWWKKGLQIKKFYVKY